MSIEKNVNLCLTAKTVTFYHSRWISNFIELYLVKKRKRRKWGEKKKKRLKLWDLREKSWRYFAGECVRPTLKKNSIESAYFDVCELYFLNALSFLFITSISSSFFLPSNASSILFPFLHYFHFYLVLACTHSPRGKSLVVKVQTFRLTLTNFSMSFPFLQGKRI